jgi:hypothetical protein
MNVGVVGDPAPQPRTLADLAMPDTALKGKKGPLGLSKEQWAAMLAAASDAFYRMSGSQSNNLGAFEQGQQQAQAQQFDREKWAQELEMQRQKAMEPPQWLQDAMLYQRLPAPQRNAVLQYEDATHPIFTATPQGTQLNRRYNGPPPEAISELRSAVAKGDQSAISEFEQVFGQGSSSAYLGQ